MKFYKSIFVLASLMLFTAQCEVIDDSNLDSPNALPPSSVDPDYLLNNIQLEARSVYRAASSYGSEMTRMRYMFGSTYENAFSPTSFNGIYGNAYADLFADTQNLLPITDEKGFLFHSGIAKTLQANALITLVDVFGDMPFSEANDATNFNPTLDNGESIYAAAQALLDAAIADFAQAVTDGAPLPDNDFFYSGGAADRADLWTRAANTMKLKAYLNTGSSSAAALVADAANSLIVTDDQDFQFQYSTIDVNPDSRHPDYAGNYIDDTGASSYMAVSYLNMFLTDKDNADPRMRYYFYRQTTTDPTDINENTCLSSFAPNHFDADDPYCLLGDGWWGRDHLMDDGIPPDGDLRTTFGVYPVGGLFDDNSGNTADRGDGNGGDGIEPILLASFTHFMAAEVEKTMNNDAAAARTHLEAAIRSSFEKVADFGDDQAGGTPFEISTANTDAYVLEALADYDADNLRAIANEYYFALWGNGYEAWNLMRRTGFPDRDDNLQPARTPNPGNWYRSVLYPSNMVERNSNIEQKAPADVLQGPFWDPSKGSTKFNF